MSQGQPDAPAQEVSATVESPGAKQGKDPARSPSIMGLISQFFSSTGRAADAVGKSEEGAFAHGVAAGVADLEQKVEAAAPHLRQAGKVASELLAKMDTEHNREFATRISAGRWAKDDSTP